MRNFLLAFAGVALLAGMFVIANTFTMLVAQRTRHFALLRAVGARRRQVRRAVLAEAAVLGLVGSTIGVALGVGLGWLAMEIIPTTGETVVFAVSPVAPLVGYLVGSSRHRRGRLRLRASWSRCGSGCCVGYRRSIAETIAADPDSGRLDSHGRRRRRRRGHLRPAPDRSEAGGGHGRGAHRLAGRDPARAAARLRRAHSVVPLGLPSRLGRVPARRAQRDPRPAPHRRDRVGPDDRPRAGHRLRDRRRFAHLLHHRRDRNRGAGGNAGRAVGPAGVPACPPRWPTRSARCPEWTVVASPTESYAEVTHNGSQLHGVHHHGGSRFPWQGADPDHRGR